MWIAALTLGLAGSLHCIGMCSPLVMMATAKQRFTGTKVIYNTGRILTYGMLGALAGALGSLLNLPGIQQYISVALGVVLILAGIGAIGHLRIPFLTSGINKLVSVIKVQFARYVPQGTRYATFVLGMLNGLLPCGLTYIALTFAMTLSAADGFLYMVTFGAATLPVMLGMTSLLSRFVMRYLPSPRFVTTAAMIVLGILLVARSYTTHSPAHSANSSAEVICK